MDISKIQGSGPNGRII
ncbi:MAG: E3 binding domain-containing protein [bacterium]